MENWRDESLLPRVQVYVFADKGTEAVDDLSVVTSRTIEESVAEVLVYVAGEARTVWDTTGCSADAFASVQVSCSSSPRSSLTPPCVRDRVSKPTCPKHPHPHPQPTIRQTSTPTVR